MCFSDKKPDSFMVSTSANNTGEELCHTVKEHVTTPCQFSCANSGLLFYIVPESQCQRTHHDMHMTINQVVYSYTTLSKVRHVLHVYCDVLLYYVTELLPCESTSTHILAVCTGCSKDWVKIGWLLPTCVLSCCQQERVMSICVLHLFVLHSPYVLANICAPSFVCFI